MSFLSILERTGQPLGKSLAKRTGVCRSKEGQRCISSGVRESVYYHANSFSIFAARIASLEFQEQPRGTRQSCIPYLVIISWYLCALHIIPTFFPLSISSAYTSRKE